MLRAFKGQDKHLARTFSRSDAPSAASSPAKAQKSRQKPTHGDSARTPRPDERCLTSRTPSQPAERGFSGQRPGRGGRRRRLAGGTQNLQIICVWCARRGCPRGTNTWTLLGHGKGASLGDSALAPTSTQRASGFVACAGCLGPGSEEVGDDLVRQLRVAQALVPNTTDPILTPSQTAVKLVRRWRPQRSAWNP